MSKKTSTAALDSFRKGQLRNQRRGPRHPAGAKRERSNERAKEFGQAQIVVRPESVMNKNAVSGTARTFRVILPVILRITFCLAMWTLGAMTMAIAEAQTWERRALQEISVRRMRAENLQRSMDTGHETRCRIRSEEITRDSLD